MVVICHLSFAVQERAKSLKLPTHVTIDAGRTQIAPSESCENFLVGLYRYLFFSTKIHMFKGLRLTRTRFHL